MTTNQPGSIRHGRWGAAMGLFFVVATVAGNEMSNSGDSPHTDAASILANVRRAHSAINEIGLSLELLGFAALLFFAAYLYRLLRNGEGSDGWLAGSVLIAASLDLAIKVGSGAPLAAVYAGRATLTPELARTLININTGGFILTGFSSAVFVLAAVTAAWSSRVLPRGWCWAGLVIAVLGLITPMLALYHPASYVPVPYLLILLWMAGVAIARFVAEGRASNTPVQRPAARSHAHEASNRSPLVS
jgi:hypothetical protein